MSEVECLKHHGDYIGRRLSRGYWLRTGLQTKLQAHGADKEHIDTFNSLDLGENHRGKILAFVPAFVIAHHAGQATISTRWILHYTRASAFSVLETIGSMMPPPQSNLLELVRSSMMEGSTYNQVLIQHIQIAVHFETADIMSQHSLKPTNEHQLHFELPADSFKKHNQLVIPTALHDVFMHRDSQPAELRAGQSFLQCYGAVLDPTAIIRNPAHGS